MHQLTRMPLPEESLPPCQRNSCMMWLIFFRMEGRKAMAMIRWVGMAASTCRTKASLSPRERREARQVGSLRAMRSTKGMRAAAETFQTERGMPK